MEGFPNLVIVISIKTKPCREMTVLLENQVSKELLESQVSLVRMFKHQRDNPVNPELKVHRALTDSMEHQVSFWAAEVLSPQCCISLLFMLILRSALGSRRRNSTEYVM